MKFNQVINFLSLDSSGIYLEVLFKIIKVLDH